MPISYDWYEVAHTYNGYEAAGGFTEPTTADSSLSWF